MSDLDELEELNSQAWRNGVSLIADYKGRIMRSVSPDEFRRLRQAAEQRVAMEQADKEDR